jgi:hypothetical protein
VSPRPPAEVELAMLAEARNEVGAADHKASMVLAVLGIGFGALLGGLIARDWSPSTLNPWGAVLWWAAAALTAASVFSAASAVWPRFTLPARTSEVFYWGHVATFAAQHDLDKALDRHPPRLEDRTRHQLFALSTIVARKYQLVRRSMALAAVAAPLFVAAGLVGY